ASRNMVPFQELAETVTTSTPANECLRTRLEAPFYNLAVKDRNSFFSVTLGHPSCSPQRRLDDVAQTCRGNPSKQYDIELSTLC
ncbi:hypothetical protein J6590_103594, partial [Homalodisca vitripennis]